MRTSRRLDLTSALFLALHHPPESLPPWSSLTTGVPAPLGEDPTANQIVTTVAARQGADTGLVARSTLHALTDIATLLPRRGDLVAVDEAAYPVVRLAVESARGQGASVHTYRHHDPESLPTPRFAGRLFVMTDGWCSGCGGPAPLRALRTSAAQTGGLLVVDDSLACGILGRRRPGDVFGDGSGLMRWCGGTHDDMLWVASFAKAYGTPISVVTGSHEVVGVLRDGGNRLHSSPPSAPDLAAGARAVELDDVPRRRAVLRARVLALRQALGAQGRPALGLPFPIVSLPMPTRPACRWWKQLRLNGIDALVQQPRCRSGALLSMVVRCDHTPEDLARVAAAIRRLDGEVAA